MATAPVSLTSSSASSRTGPSLGAASALLRVEPGGAFPGPEAPGRQRPSAAGHPRAPPSPGRPSSGETPEDKVACPGSRHVTPSLSGELSSSRAGVTASPGAGLRGASRGARQSASSRHCPPALTSRPGQGGSALHRGRQPPVRGLVCGHADTPRAGPCPRLPRRPLALQPAGGLCGGRRRPGPRSVPLSRPPLPTPTPVLGGLCARSGRGAPAPHSPVRVPRLFPVPHAAPAGHPRCSVPPTPPFPVVGLLLLRRPREHPASPPRCPHPCRAHRPSGWRQLCAHVPRPLSGGDSPRAQCRGRGGGTEEAERSSRPRLPHRPRGQAAPRWGQQLPPPRPSLPPLGSAWSSAASALSLGGRGNVLELCFSSIFTFKNAIERIGVTFVN